MALFFATFRVNCTPLAKLHMVTLSAIDREPNQDLLRQSITLKHLNGFELTDDVALFAQRRFNMQSAQRPSGRICHQRQQTNR